VAWGNALRASTSCKHFSVPARDQVKASEAVVAELVAAECDTDRLANAANVTRDAARGPNTRQARAPFRPDARPSCGKARGDNRRVPQAVPAELVRGGDAGGAGEPPDQPPDGGFAEATAVPV